MSPKHKVDHRLFCLLTFLLRSGDNFVSHVEKRKKLRWYLFFAKSSFLVLIYAGTNIFTSAEFWTRLVQAWADPMGFQGYPDFRKLTRKINSIFFDNFFNIFSIYFSKKIRLLLLFILASATGSKPIWGSWQRQEIWPLFPDKLLFYLKGVVCHG